MNNATYTHMTSLFEQLGLESSNQAIAQFIEQHQLDARVSILDAPFWTEPQRYFLAKKLETDDGAWAIIIDQLNEALHADST